MSKLFAPLVLVLCALALAGAAEVDSTKRCFDRQQLQVHTGTATVNSATADYSKWQPLVTFAPDSNTAAQDVTISLDLAKASTGFGAVYTSGTITASWQRKVDGTNWRTESNSATSTVTGTLAGAASEGLSLTLHTHVVGPTEGLRLAIRISSVSNTNVVIPYVVYFRSGATATITPAS